MGHDSRHMATTLETRQHVLHEHEVGFFAGLWAPLLEAVSEFHGCTTVILRKRRVGQHPVKFANLAILQNLRVLQSITVLYGKTADVVEDHVHVADGPDRTIRVLSIKGQVVGILTLLFDILMGLNQKAA